MFSVDSDFEILLEHDKKGNVVGEAKPGAEVDAATGTIIVQVRINIASKCSCLRQIQGQGVKPTTMVEYASVDLGWITRCKYDD